MERKTIIALCWIVDLLNQKNIRYQITGGFAAKLYGSPRDLYDLDIDIDANNFNQLLPFVDPYIISGPQRYKDDSFAVWLLSLCYHGQLIDLSLSQNARIFNKTTKKWEDSPTNFDQSNIVNFGQQRFNVIPKDELIIYKKIIGRPTDLIDVQNIS